MKVLALILVLFMFGGCSTLSNPEGALQPVKYKNLKDKTYYTTCSGGVEEWGSCFYKAKKTCEKGFEVVERKEEVVGGKRELTFRCNS